MKNIYNRTSLALYGILITNVSYGATLDSFIKPDGGKDVLKQGIEMMDTYMSPATALMAAAAAFVIPGDLKTKAITSGVG